MVELPENKKEAAFIIQLLQKLNLVIKKPAINETDLPEELVKLLEDRLNDLEQNRDNEMSLEAFSDKYF
jgi:hypothetical protein